MLILLTIVVHIMSGFTDEDFPTKARRLLDGGRADRRTRFDESRHFAFEAPKPVGGTTASGGASSSSAASMATRVHDVAPDRERRGRYDRSAAQGKLPYAQTAYEHRLQAEEHSMGRPCLGSCPFQRKCGLNITPAHLMRAHVYAYGDNTTMHEEDGVKTYSCARTMKEVQQRRRELILNAISQDAADPSRRVERFLVDGVGPVCPEYCRAAHGVPRGTWNAMVAAARNGSLQAKIEWDDAARELTCLEDDANVTAKEETIAWWKLWLTLEDQMPNEPVIIHRVVIWEQVWADEYSSDIAWFGTTQPLSRSRWVEYKAPALRELSIEWFGANATTGDPLCNLSLRQRAKHSNFSSCNICANNLNRWIEFRTSDRRLSALDARKFKEELHWHISDVKAQRARAQQMAQECALRKGLVFEYDDACGSGFLYMPFTPRESAAEASRYKYRFAMQCNLFPGKLLRLSLIPPCVVKGGNFGCTAYFSSLVRMEELGMLEEENTRQTDSGPDNDCKTTHAFHWSLVHYGVMNRLTWIRLMPKHSHNYADRVNSMVIFRAAIHDVGAGREFKTSQLVFHLYDVYHPWQPRPDCCTELTRVRVQAGYPRCR